MRQPEGGGQKVFILWLRDSYGLVLFGRERVDGIEKEAAKKGGKVKREEAGIRASELLTRVVDVTRHEYVHRQKADEGTRGSRLLMERE